MNISFVGGGVMAEAIIGGVLDAHLVRPDEIGVCEPVAARRDHLQAEYGLRAYVENAPALEGADIVLLAVKPQSLPEVMNGLRGVLPEHVAVASIVAGARMATLAEGLGHAAVIRIMPNTPAQIGAGMSVWTAAPGVSQDTRDAVGEILRTLGDEVYVPDEKVIDMATALSASGPAYVFLFIEALIDAGVYLGMDRAVARRLTLQTVLGSTRLVQESGRHPADLKDMVTSPGGTTVEALLALEESGVRAALINAVAAAYEKSKALG